MKILKFKEEFIYRILDGMKTTTWRLFDDKDLQDGDELSLRDSETGEEFAKARITSVVEKTLGQVDDSDFDEDHENPGSREELVQRYREYYGEQANLDSPLKILTFELIP